MYAADLLQEFQAVGLQAYPLDDQIGTKEPMVEFLARPLFSEILTLQPNPVAYGELT